MPEEAKKEDFTEDTSSVENTEVEKQAREMGWKPESRVEGRTTPTRICLRRRFC